MNESDNLNGDSELNNQRVIKSGRKKHKKKKGKISKSEHKEIEVSNEEPKIKKVNELEECYNCRKDPEECFLHLQNFYNNLKETIPLLGISANSTISDSVSKIERLNNELELELEEMEM